MEVLEWYDVVLRLALAALFGALVGLERESAGQDAGFRTHLLLALGSAVFGAISVGGFDAFITDDPTNVQVDVTRVASYVAAGVGFIGGGVIIKHAGSVRGITTATSLWTAAAIGLAAGLGFWAAAITATVIALVALAALKPLSDWVGKRSHPPRSLVVQIAGPTAATDVLRAVQQEVPGAIRSMQLGQGESDGHELVVQFWTQPDDDTIHRLVTRIKLEFGEDIRSVHLLS